MRLSMVLRVPAFSDRVTLATFNGEPRPATSCASSALMSRSLIEPTCSTSPASTFQIALAVPGCTSTCPSASATARGKPPMLR